VSSAQREACQVEVPSLSDISEYIEYEFDQQGNGTVTANNFPRMVKTVLVTSNKHDSISLVNACKPISDR